MADRLGVLASAACAVHCAMVPVLLVAGTALPAALLNEEYFHKAILLVVLPVALVAFGVGCRQHKDSRVMILGGIGLAGILSAAFLHEVLGESGERMLTLISATLLIAAHLRNYRLCRAASCEHD